MAIKITTKIEIVKMAKFSYKRKRIYINGKETLLALQNGGVYLKYTKQMHEHCIIREPSNTLALKAFKKSLGII